MLFKCLKILFYLIIIKINNVLLMCMYNLLFNIYLLLLLIIIRNENFMLKLLNSKNKIKNFNKLHNYSKKHFALTSLHSKYVILGSGFAGLSTSKFLTTVK
jgi:hypothetical protein